MQAPPTDEITSAVLSGVLWILVRERFGRTCRLATRLTKSAVIGSHDACALILLSYL